MGSKLIKLYSLCLEKNVPFASYRLPGSEQVITWVQRSGKMLFLENISGILDDAGFLYAPFHRNTNFPVVMFEPEFIFRDEEMGDEIIAEIENSKPLYADYQVERPYTVEKTEYLAQAEKMIRSFSQGISKAVLSRVVLEEKPAGFDAGRFFLKLVRTYPDAFCHLINIPGAGCWAGASPEMLFRSDGADAETVALAGTRKYSASADPEWEEKEIREQEMVSRHIESVLEECHIRNYVKGQTRTVKAGNVLHLATPYRFTTDSNPFHKEEFIQRLHPTPAVGGLPKDRALELIADTEKHNREYYAGFCGPLNFEGHTDLFVNLRCMKILPGELAVFAGGGLTSGSIPAREWEETEWKAKTLLTLI